ncbi:MAG TPA: metalloprotease family protein [Terriglobales bacterium]|nr:metalloprotease family protein [Terriglobales bacterium]
MVIIPGFLIALATFPGVIIHEAAHLLFCRMTGLAVFDVKFFQLSNPAGYVIHEQTDDFKKTFLVSMGPFFVNTLLCLVFCLAAFLPIWELKIDDYLGYFFYWLGISIGMHAFPSTVDLKHIWKLAPQYAKKGNLLAILSYPIVVVLYPLNFLRVVWADLGYGLAVGILGPLAIFKALA